MGSKLQRQNQHIRRLTSKIKRHKKRGWSTERMEKELSYCTGRLSAQILIRAELLMLEIRENQHLVKMNSN